MLRVCGMLFLSVDILYEYMVIVILNFIRIIPYCVVVLHILYVLVCFDGGQRCDVNEDQQAEYNYMIDGYCT